VDPSGDGLDIVLERVVAAYGRLAELGEEIDDEWTYIQDLTAAWITRIDEVGAARGDQPLAPETVTALDGAIAQIDLITDPHRAIDWLSTFPQVTLIALGEAP